MNPEEKETVLKAIRDQRELMQNDLQCILDGLDDSFITQVCQMIVDRTQLIEKAVTSE